MTFTELRECFPHTQHQVYLNHAATSPISRPVREAVDRYLDLRHGADADAPIDAFESYLLPLLGEARERAGRMLNADPERVAFVQNTSEGLNVLAEGLDWQAGDRVAVPDGCFPTNVYPWLNQQSRGVTVDFIPTTEGAYSVEDVERTLTPQTRVLSVSWVHFLSGFRADLRAIGRLCQERGVLFCVDAIQGLGALQMDVQANHVDFLAAGSHKWMMGMQGVGFLYCTEALQHRLQGPAGWLHGPVDWEHLDEYDLTFHDDARQFSTGTLNAAGLSGVNAAMKLYLEVGPEAMEERVLDLSAHLAGGLAGLGMTRYGSSDPEHGSGIVTVEPAAPEALAEHLKEHRITGALRNRKLRLAPHAYNTPDDVDHALEAIAAFGG